MADTRQTERLKSILRPDVLAELGVRVNGPLDLLQLGEQLEQGRCARGENCVAASPAVERVIVFRPETWERLSRLAAQLATPEAAVTPAQLAALLVESGLAGADSQH